MANVDHSQPKAPQKRALFGQWKPKVIPGYPERNAVVPEGTSAEQICQHYPNHITDYVIRTLMRDGKGAKAIDDLIPGPPGKEKAAQSHSKIQLRVSTIREAFDGEDFPITSSSRSRRQREQSQASQIQDATPGGDYSSPFSPPLSSTVSSPAQTTRTTDQDLNDLPRDAPGDFTLHPTVYDQNPFLAGLAPTDHYSSRQHQSSANHPMNQQQPTSEAVEPSPNLGPDPFLPERMTSAYDESIELATDILRRLGSCATEELRDSAIDYCHAWYDSESRHHQVVLGVAYEKELSDDDTMIEHPILYLRTSILQCFSDLEDWEEQLDLEGCDDDQVDYRVQLATSERLITRMEELVSQLRTRRQALVDNDGHHYDLDDDPDFAPHITPLREYHPDILAPLHLLPETDLVWPEITDSVDAHEHDLRSQVPTDQQ